MRNLKNVALGFILTFLPVFSYALEPKENACDTINCLELKGRVIRTGGTNSDLCKVELFLKGKVVDSVFTAETRAFNFRLLRNEMYTLRITKKGHVPKLVVVNTDIPSEINDVLEFSFKTDLLSHDSAKNLNKDALDFPTAIIYFDEKDELFVYNEEYTKKINQEIHSQEAGNKMLAKASK